MSLPSLCRTLRDHPWREAALDLMAGAALAVALSLLLDRASFGLGSTDAWVFFYGQF